MNVENQQTRKLLAELARHRVVTRDDLAQAFHRHGSSLDALVRSLRNKGLITPVRRGVYAIVPLENNPDRFHPDPLLAVHSALGPGYAFSHFTALQLHGAEHFPHRTIHVTKPEARSRKMKVGPVAVHVHGTKHDNWDLITTTLRRGKQTLHVTTPERTLLDLVGLPPKQQDYWEVVDAYRDLRPKLSMPDLLAEAMTFANKTTLARLGHLILHHSPSSHGDVFQGKMGEFITLRSPTYFGTSPKQEGNCLDKDFNVVYPEGA